MFKDEDVKRLKRQPGEGFIFDASAPITNNELQALLARLEAAEKVLNVLEKCEDLRNFEWFHHAHDCFKVWRASAGK